MCYRPAVIPKAHLVPVCIQRNVRKTQRKNRHCFNPSVGLVVLRMKKIEIVCVIYGGQHCWPV